MRVLDLGTLASVDPRAVGTYLRAKGWQLADATEGRSQTWTLPDEARDLLVPLSKQLDDFATRIAEIVLTLERIERRPYSDILHALLTMGDDVARFHVVRGDARDGTVPLDYGATMMSAVRNMFRAAAASVVHPRRSHAHPPDMALKFLEHARLGQTERGSYIVTVLSRLPEQPPLFPTEVPDPFERRVFVTLATSLAAVKSAAQEGSLDRFASAVGDGVSANLCSALADLGEDESAQAIEVELAWAPSLPPPPQVPSRVSFGAALIPAVREGGKHLGRTEQRAGFKLMGFVIKLQREQAEFESELGTATVMGNVDGNIRQVRVGLNAEAHALAIRAYEQKLPVVVEGDLQQEGVNAFRLDRPRRFRVAPPPQ